MLHTLHEAQVTFDAVCNILLVKLKQSGAAEHLGHAYKIGLGDGKAVTGNETHCNVQLHEPSEKGT